MIEYVCGFLFDPKGRVALVRKSHPAWQRGKLNGCGGHVEPNEAPFQAMAREAMEEVGFVSNLWQRFAIVTDERTFRVHFFADECDDASRIRGTEDEPVITVGVDALAPWPIVPNLRYLIPLAAMRDSLAEPVRIVERIQGGV